MKALIKKIDFFPYRYRQPMFGEDAYKTSHGGCMSIIAMLFAIAAFVLFGEDFIYKLNPSSFTQKVKIPSEELISFPLENTSFSLMYKFEDASTKNFSLEEEFVYGTAIYLEYINNGDTTYNMTKQRRFKTNRCDKTTNRNNPLNAKIDLSKWYCIDFEDYKQRYNDDPFFAGNWTDAKIVRYFSLDFNTCKFDFETNDFDRSNCSSHDKIHRLTTENDYFLSFLAPKINFDIKNFENPVVNFYDYFWYKLRSSAGGRRNIYFDYTQFQDDRGWILEEITTVSDLSIHERTEESYTVTETELNAGNVMFARLVFYMNDASVIYFRSYAKIQQVTANIGGVLKVITIVCRLGSNLLGSRLLLIEMVSKFYCFDLVSNELVIKPSLVLDDSQRSVDSVKQLKGKKIKTIIGQFSSLKVALNLFCGYKRSFFRQIWRKGERIQEEMDVMKQIDSYLESRDKISLKTRKQF